MRQRHPHPIQTSEIDGVVVHYRRGTGATVRGLIRAADEGGIIQAGEMVALTGDPRLHTTTTLDVELHRIGAWEDHEDEQVTSDARRIARRVRAGSDSLPCGDWRRAGYTSRYEAARMTVVPDGTSPEAVLAAALVAEDMR